MHSASLYDRLERALIALEYALADARSAEQQPPEAAAVSRSQEALQSAGEELREVLSALREIALHDAAARVREWT
jgi:signal transduction histidine kinase